MRVKKHGLRWTQSRACDEFNINIRTLSKRLKAADISPDRDGNFSTAEIVRAIFGDIQGERLRKLREEADYFAIRNAQAKKELVPADEVRLAWEDVGLRVREKILGLAGKIEARYIVGMPGVELRQIIDHETDECLLEISGNPYKTNESKV